MAEYIEREAFKQKYLCCGYLPEMSEKEFDEFPTADVAPVVHGRWIKDAFLSDDVNNAEKCSQCGELIGWFGNLPNYCPNCGAKMDRGEDRAVS